MRERKAFAAGVLLPFLLYLAAVALLGGWVVDDAGISFAYARNLAEGHGLVSQPGREPVEGFSNFFWVALLAPFFAARLFHPVWTPKILSALFVFVSLALVHRTLRRGTASAWPGAFCCAALALSPPLAIWTTSGLENGLLLLLATLLWWVLVERPRRWAALSGAVVGLLALTRPDGLALAAVGPSLMLLEAFALRERRGVLAGALLRHLGAALAVAGPYLAFRRLYFGLWWPHPYYAKREWLGPGERLRDLLGHPAAALEKMRGLAEGVAGPAGAALLLAALAALLVLLARRGLPRHLGVASLIALFGAASYLWIERDWMGEHRFATPVAAMAPIVIFGALHAALRAIPRLRHASFAPAAGALVLAALLAGFLPRLSQFASRPTVPYADVSRRGARRLGDLARELGLERASALVADAGAMLVESGLTVYDAAGLFEPAVVSRLKMGGPVWRYDHPGFNDWVFEEVRPTFIVTHKFWTNVTAFELDPRFARDYAAIESYVDPYVALVFGRRLRSGEFVRRDALGREGTDALRALPEPPPRRSSAPHRIADAAAALLGRRPTPEELLREARVALYLRDDPDRAAELAERALAAAPEDAEALRLLAEALDLAMRPGEARRHWERLAASARLAGNAGLEAVARARLDGGVDSAAAMTLSAPDAGPPVEDHVEASLRLIRERRFPEAIAACRAALRRRPDPAAYNNLCVAWNELGAWDRAAEACLEAVRLKPDFALARNNYAWALRAGR